MELGQKFPSLGQKVSELGRNIAALGRKVRSLGQKFPFWKRFLKLHVLGGAVLGAIIWYAYAVPQ